MINCQNLTFSFKLAQQRMEQSKNILGDPAFNRIMCFSLYNLGVNRTELSTALNMPVGTIKSTIRAVNNGGIIAFEDRRKKVTITASPPPLPPTQKATVKIEEQTTIINLGHSEIKIPNCNPIQIKVFLLTLLNNGLLRNTEVARLLNISKAHVTNLSKGLNDNDVLSLIDKRKGQQKDYIFDEKIKAEMIQQFVANVITGNSTSSTNITDQVNTACNTNVSDRTIRKHVSKLGLKKIKQSLPELLDELKKTQKNRK